MYVAEADLLAEVHNFTGILVEMGRITLVDQNQMELGFLEFTAAFRRESRPAGTTVEYSSVDFLRYCSSCGAQNLLQLVFCVWDEECRALPILRAMELGTYQAIL